jgi:hypothetical protein
MAKKASPKDGGKNAKKSVSKSVAQVGSSSSGGRSDKDGGFDAGEAFVKLLQSPLVAELVAVAATAALASLAEHGFATGAPRGKRAGKAVKEAGKAAAAAVGRRLGTEIDEIRKAAKPGAKA